SLIINNPDFAANSDLSTTQFQNGFLGALVLQATSPTGSLTSYTLGLPPSSIISFPVTDPGYDTSGNATTFTRTIYATAPAEQSTPPFPPPTENANGGTARIGLPSSAFIYGSAPSTAPATVNGAAYNGFPSTTVTGVPITNNSTRAYPIAIGTWVTDMARVI